jgi:hypothetical protein
MQEEEEEGEGGEEEEGFESRCYQHIYIWLFLHRTVLRTLPVSVTGTTLPSYHIFLL